MLPNWRALGVQDGSASFQSEWLDCSECNGGGLLIIQPMWDAVAATSGTLGVQGTTDPLKSTDSIITLPAFTDGIYGAWPTVGAAKSSGLVIIENPMPFMRYTYTRTAGGAAGQFSGFYWVRR